MKVIRCSNLLLLSGILQATALFEAAGDGASSLWAGQWERHTIDDSSRGADGVRLADINRDGLPDIATGWEEGGVTRVYLHPGHELVSDKWPSVTVGSTPDVEDAVFCDVDGDGAIDVVTSSEGRAMRVLVHRAPNVSNYLTSHEWESSPFPATLGMTRWMFCLPMDVDGRNGIDLVLGSKDPDGVVGWLESPTLPGDFAGWNFHSLYQAGWVMSLAGHDIDEDGDVDLVISDRKGASSGVLWLENPGPRFARASWKEHRVGGVDREVMFLHVADVDGDGRAEISVATKPDEIQIYHASADPRGAWESRTIKVGFSDGVGRAKAVRVGDIDLDGRPDLVYSCEGAVAPRHGVVWLRQGGSPE